MLNFNMKFFQPFDQFIRELFKERMKDVHIQEIRLKTGFISFIKNFGIKNGLKHKFSILNSSLNQP